MHRRVVWRAIGFLLMVLWASHLRATDHVFPAGVRLGVDGSTNPEGDVLNISTIIDNGSDVNSSTVEYTIFAFTLSTTKATAPAAQRVTAVPGDFPLRVRPEGPARKGLIHRIVVVPFATLKLKSGDHFLAYQINTIVQGKTVFSEVTEARTIRVSEGVATFDESRISFKDTEGRHQSSAYALKDGDLLVYNFKPTITERRDPSKARVEREGGYETLALDSHTWIPAKSMQLSAPSQQRRMYVVTNRNVNPAAVDGTRFGIDANGASYGSVGAIRLWRVKSAFWGVFRETPARELAG